MKALISLLFALVLTAAIAVAAGSTSLVAMTPDSMHWTAGTGASKGLMLATLSGDPTKSGTSIIRVKMPDGYTNAPHYHAHAEMITVIQGTILFGTGDKVDKSKARAFRAGSFVAVPAGLHHWSIAKGDTIEQVAGEGPINNIPIKPGKM